VSARVLYWLVGGVVVVIAVDKLTRVALSAVVSAAILDKLGPDPPASARRAAKAAGRCFAEDLSIPDLVDIGLKRLQSGG